MRRIWTCRDSVALLLLVSSKHQAVRAASWGKGNGKNNKPHTNNQNWKESENYNDDRDYNPISRQQNEETWQQGDQFYEANNDPYSRYQSSSSGQSRTVWDDPTSLTTSQSSRTEWDDPSPSSFSNSPPPPLGNQPPPPPPRPPTQVNPQHSQYEPIHYNFPKEIKKDSGKATAKKGGWFRRGRKDGADEDEDNELPAALAESLAPPVDVPQEQTPIDGGGGEFYDRRGRRSRRSRDDDEPQFASARRDVVTQYRSTFNGKVKLAISSGIAGSIVGGFLGKSLLNSPWALASVFFFIFWLCSFLRNAYGELIRALGMALILSFSRTSSIRRRYPTWRHVGSSFGVKPRRPFPPASNPWTYSPRSSRDPEFRMLFTVLAMGFVGSTCGGSIPLIPTWIGSVAGAAFFALSTTMQNARGDLSRSMGMRVVALVEEFFIVNKELDILRKGGVVSGKILDKILILDRQHRIKDRLVAGASFAAQQVSNQMNRVQADMQQSSADEGNRGRRPPASDDEERRARRFENEDRSGEQRRRRPSSDYREGDRRPPRSRDDWDGRGPPS